MSQSKYDQVVEAFRQLTEAGETVTQDKIKAIILEKTGVKMSNSTVAKHLQQLRASNPDEFLKGSSSDASEPIPGEHENLMKMVYHSIRRATELTYSTARTESLESEIEILQERLGLAESVRSELSGLRYAYETQLKRTEELIRENEGLKAGITPEVQPVVDELNAQLEAIASERDQLRRSNAQLSQLDQERALELTILKNRLDAITAERQELQQRIEELTIANGRLEPLETELKEAMATVDSLRKQLGSKGEQMTSLGGELCYVTPHLSALIDQEIAMRTQPLLEEIEHLKAESTQPLPRGKRSQ